MNEYVLYQVEALLSILCRGGKWTLAWRVVSCVSQHPSTRIGILCLFIDVEVINMCKKYRLNFSYLSQGEYELHYGMLCTRTGSRHIPSCYVHFFNILILLNQPLQQSTTKWRLQERKEILHLLYSVVIILHLLSS